MTQAGGDGVDSGDADATIGTTAAVETNEDAESLRHSLPSIGTSGDEPSAHAPSKRLRKDSAGGAGDDADRIAAAGVAQSTGGSDGGGGGGEAVGENVSADADASKDAAAAAAAAAASPVSPAPAPAASVVTTEPPAEGGGAALKFESGGSSSNQTENHLSSKYTKEEFIARQWGMNLVQMKRVKALLTMGVCEEDLEIADRLLKMGRDISNDTPLTKEEQLLGYTAHQRQRMKALQILGLTEESFERCRAVMLSSLGPSAFGYNADETAASAASAVAEEGWTPGDKFLKKWRGQHHGGGAGGGGGGAGSGSGSGGGGGHHGHGLLRMPTFGNGSSSSHIGGLGGGSNSKMFPTGVDAGAGGGHFSIYARGAGLGAKISHHMRRRSDSDKGEYLPDIEAGSRKSRGPGISSVRAAGGGSSVAVGMPPLGTIAGSPAQSVPGCRTPLSMRTDPG